MTPSFKARALRSLLQGISILDLPKLEITSMEEADLFLKSYGVDIKDPEQWSYIQSLYKRSVYFLFDYLLQRKVPSPDLPRSLTDFAELGRILMQASRNPEVVEARSKTFWACAVLRISHALFHAEHDWKNRYLPLAEEQIIRPIAALTSKAPDGTKWLGPPNQKKSIRLVDFTYRLEKPFESLLMKLIHKPQVVAQDIYDRVGLRFVTHRKIDAVRVLQYLLDENVMSIAHLVPRRSRNTLFDLESAFVLLDEWDGNEATLDQIEERLTAAVPSSNDNVVSSAQYKACHVTLRKLVAFHEQPSGTHRFFLPFEIQIMDQTSFEDSVMGYSSHDEYKATQRDMVLRRILGEELYGSVISPAQGASGGSTS